MANAVPPTVPIDGRPDRRRMAVIAATALVAMLIYFLLPSWIGELQRRMLAIFVVAAVFWATEALPLFATSLLVIGFEILFLADEGGLAARLPAVAGPPDRSLSYELFLAPLGSPIIILFLGGFLLSAALTRHGMDRAIAAKVLRPFARSPLALLLGVLGITAFFSMWMSNTATTAMMLAIVAPILRGLPDDEPLQKALVLAVPFGANIGGIGTPIGSPPNAVAFGLVNASDTGITLSFLDWMLLAVPLELLSLAAAAVLLYAIYRPSAGLVIKPIEPPPPGRISGRGWVTLAILIAAIVLWLTGDLIGIRAAGVALLVAVALAATGAIDRSAVNSIDWDILILLWGGLSLGAAIEATGLTDLIAAIDFDAMPGGEIAVAALVALVTIGISTFMSSTAAANLVVPIALALSVGAAGTRVELALLAALTCAFGMAMPVSTPPNAMAFATGRVSVKDMVVLGATLSALGVIVLLAGYKVMLPLVIRGL